MKNKGKESEKGFSSVALSAFGFWFVIVNEENMKDKRSKAKNGAV